MTLLHPRSRLRHRPTNARRLLVLTAAGASSIALTVYPASAAPASAQSPASAAQSAQSAASPQPMAAPPGWSTLFSDSFSGGAGSGADGNWTYDIGTQYNGTGCTGNWGTGEVESETSSTANVSQDGNGHLGITAVNSGGSWTSGRIETVADNFAAPPGGQLEVTASIQQPAPANGVGYWPAFWMLGAGFRGSGAGTSGTMNCSNWPSTGEIDIMEDVNALSEHSGTLHCGVDPGGPCNETTGQSSGLQSCSGCQTGYHTYSVIIDRTNTSAESITWYLDGNSYYSVNESQVGTAVWQSAVDHGFFLILDVGVGGSYPNVVCGCSSPTEATSSGATMKVTDVAVYQTAGSGSGGGSYPSGYHQLVADNSGLCVDVSGASTSTGAPVIQWTCKSGGGSNQEWQFNPVSGGYGELQNQNSGQDLVVLNASTSAGAKVIQWTQNGTTNGLWRPIALSNGSWQFQNENSGQCLDVTGASSSLSVQLEQWPCKSNAAGSNQAFATR